MSPSYVAVERRGKCDYKLLRLQTLTARVKCAAYIIIMEKGRGECGYSTA